MILLPTLRSMARIYRGLRPHLDDLERILAQLRVRRQRGQWVASQLLPRLARRSKGGDPMRGTRALQTRKLRNTVEYAYRYLPFYQQALDERHLKPADIRTLDDVVKLPITRRANLEANWQGFISRCPGIFPAIPVSSAGTTGKPTILYMTTDEYEYYTTSEAITGLLGHGVWPDDILQLHSSIDFSSSALLRAAAARKAGALALTCGEVGTLEDHVRSLVRERNLPGKKPKVSGLFASPGHLWGLLRTSQEMGVAPGEFALEHVATGGATVSEELKQRIQEVWGIRLSEGYSMTEILSCAAAECDERRYLHFLDLTGYAEVLDPQTEEPVPPGQPGVLVVTSFYPDRELTPLLRYWTNDLVVMSPEVTCPCGLTSTQIVDIQGRADQMVTLGMNNLYPQLLGDGLLSYRELVLPPRFRFHTEERDDQQVAILDVELAAPLAAEGAEQLRQRIIQDVIAPRSHDVELGGVRVVVNLLPAGSIARPFSYKTVELGPEQWGRPPARRVRGWF